MLRLSLWPSRQPFALALQYSTMQDKHGMLSTRAGSQVSFAVPTLTGPNTPFRTYRDARLPFGGMQGGLILRERLRTFLKSASRKGRTKGRWLENVSIGQPQSLGDRDHFLCRLDSCVMVCFGIKPNSLSRAQLAALRLQKPPPQGPLRKRLHLSADHPRTVR